MTQRIYRYEIEVDDQPHSFELTGGDPVRVEATPDSRIVQFWAVSDETVPPRKRTFQVVGTGHPLPTGARWRGTTSRTPGGLVWHLVELEARQDPSDSLTGPAST